MTYNFKPLRPSSYNSYKFQILLFFAAKNLFELEFHSIQLLLFFFFCYVQYADTLELIYINYICDGLSEIVIAFRKKTVSLQLQWKLI